jgi:hypothetical protein
VLHAGKGIKPLRNRPLQMRSEVLQAVNAENTANYAPLQSINDPEPSCNFPFMEGHVPKPQNYTPLLGNNDHFPTRLLPKLHGYSPKQHEYQFFVIDTDYILNLIRASFTVLYNSVFLKSLPRQHCRSGLFSFQMAGLWKRTISPSHSYQSIKPPNNEKRHINLLRRFVIKL